MNVIMVDDDVRCMSAVRFFMECMGHKVYYATDVGSVLELLGSVPVDMLLLEWKPSSACGEALLRHIRAQAGTHIGILCIINQSAEMELLLTSRLLFDDYILKPFAGVELVARIEAWWQRRATAAERYLPIRVGDFELNLHQRAVSLRGEPICLTPKEFFLLLFMFRNVGKILSRSLISVAAWGRPLDGMSRTLDTHIYRLRKKLGLSPENGVYLASVYTLGYRLDEIRAGDTGDYQREKDRGAILANTAVA